MEWVLSLIVFYLFAVFIELVFIGGFYNPLIILVFAILAFISLIGILMILGYLIYIKIKKSLE